NVIAPAHLARAVSEDVGRAAVREDGAGDQRREPNPFPCLGLVHVEWAGPDGALIQPDVGGELMSKRPDVFGVAGVINKIAPVDLVNRRCERGLGVQPTGTHQEQERSETYRTMHLPSLLAI